MLQQKKPDDYVVATGEFHSVREFVDLAFREIGAEIQWKGKGVKEVGIIGKVRSAPGEIAPAEERKFHGAVKSRVTTLKKGNVVVEIDPRYFRPTEVDELLGDASKARKSLGWEPKISFEEMVSTMVKADIEEASRDQLCRDSGYRVLNYSNE
jgi:GDPmannose 4,6-dehydratase